MSAKRTSRAGGWAVSKLKVRWYNGQTAGWEEQTFDPGEFHMLDQGVMVQWVDDGKQMQSYFPNHAIIFMTVEK